MGFTLQLFINHYLYIYTNLSSFFFMLLFLYSLTQFVHSNSFRYKFIYFYLLLLGISIWGFFFNIEGFIFLLLLAELLIIMLFILIYLTLQFFSTQKNNTKYITYYTIVFIFMYIFNNSIYSTHFFNYINPYQYINIITSDDFFIFFYFFFITFPMLVYFTGIILTIFSIFFILFYFSCKNFLFIKKKLNKTTYLLRKQNLTHQSKIKPTYSTFQK